MSTASPASSGGGCASFRFQGRVASTICQVRRQGQDPFSFHSQNTMVAASTTNPRNDLSVQVLTLDLGFGLYNGAQSRKAGAKSNRSYFLNIKYLGRSAFPDVDLEGA
jgi:hypothetical protein